MAFLAFAGPTMQKLAVFFKDLNTTGPVLVAGGTNESWPKGVEVKIIKHVIQNDCSYDADELHRQHRGRHA